MEIFNSKNLISSVLKAQDLLDNNNVIIHPTETIYGFAGNALSTDAFEKINFLKGRKPDMPYLHLFSSINEAKENGVVFSKLALDIAKKFWPGALTIILPLTKNHKLKSVATNGTVGCRVSPNIFIQELLKICNFPLLSTSVNKTGTPPLLNSKEIIKDFGDNVPLFSQELEHNISNKNLPSTIISIVENKVKLIREGAISWSKIEKEF